MRHRQTNRRPARTRHAGALPIGVVEKGLRFLQRLPQEQASAPEPVKSQAPYFFAQVGIPSRLIACIGASGIEPVRQCPAYKGHPMRLSPCLTALALLMAGLSAAVAKVQPFTAGWDNFNEPLNYASSNVKWSYSPSSKALTVTYNGGGHTHQGVSGNCRHFLH
jgi:hypothetical protein